MVGMVMEVDRDDDCDNIGLGCALEHFSEVEDVINMIDNVKNIYQTPELEVQYDKLNNILKQYYEQPHLLDPHLERILTKFIALIKDTESSVDLKHAVFNYMYQIIRVRGYKVVVRHLPHECTDLLMVLSFLEAQDPNDKENWRSRFVLLLWLSIVVIIPFHMSRLDGFGVGDKSAEDSKKLTVMERIFNICKTYALTRDTCAEASAFLASKFLTRSDVKDMYMSAFFDWACELHSNIKEEGTIHYGVLAAVAAVLKHGKRDDLLPYAPKLLEWISTQNYRNHSAMLVRKYGVKIVQRIVNTPVQLLGENKMVGMVMEVDRDDDCDNIGLGCALEHFSEVEDVINMIDNVKNIYQTPELEVQYDKLNNILKQYYEQPHLLDPHLERILTKFIALIKDTESSVDLKHAVFNYMYQIIRVRGYKVVVRHLPHECTDLLMVLSFLEAQDPNDKENWRSRFVLLLWLSIVVIIPFHMSRLDGFGVGDGHF